MQIAMFSPIPPTRSGIASYTAALLPWLARHHDIDLFTDDRPGDPTPLPAGAARRFSAYDFVWRRTREPYDLVIYQLGNSPVHSYMWPYMVRYPGLVVLHDGSLHDERCFHYFSRDDMDGYRAEFAWNDPEHADAARVVGGMSGPLRLHWPMLRTPLSTARAVALHSSWLASWLRERYPRPYIDVVRPGVDDPLSDESAVAREDIRARHQLAPSTIVFGAYGWITPWKRISEILRALHAIAFDEPDIHLLLVGSPVDHYDVRANLREAGVEGRVTLTGYVDDADVPRYLAAADICMCLRWPTTRESSATWLHAVAAGKATIVTDLAHMNDIPVLAAAQLRPQPSALSPTSLARLLQRTSDGTSGSPAPIAVAVDICHEERELKTAMLALGRDDKLRRNIGAAARAWWAARHRMEHSAEDYERVMAAAVAQPAVQSAIPPHLDHDGGDRAREILAPFGLSPNILRDDRA